MSERLPASPRIDDLAWGRMAVDGVGTAKDFKLWPGGGREWDWTETGTHHVPGIQPADVDELLDHGSQAIVLTRGQLRMLQICPETMRLLESRGIDVYVAESREGAKLYNELAATGAPVGGLFHSTC